MVDRRDWAGWLQGPRKSLESQGIELGYPGERLGLPEHGSGSIARFGRRIVALVIDWASALVIANAVKDYFEIQLELSILVLVVFLIHTSLFISLFSSSFGHRLAGIEIRSMVGRRVSPLFALSRQILVCLVVPAVIYDRDQRGLHDKALKLIAVRV
jgi:uncharacterized RDD family membrane protein YckC